MESLERVFSDNEGNHLLVALDFYDNAYKQGTLLIPEEFSDTEIIDISIEKVFVDKPIHYSVFFAMSSWLLERFSEHDNAVFTYICSFDDLDTNHKELKPHIYRWTLFDTLFRRIAAGVSINTQYVIVGPAGYESMGRAFYRDKHASIIHIVSSHLKDKQRQYI